MYSICKTTLIRLWLRFKSFILFIWHKLFGTREEYPLGKILKIKDHPIYANHVVVYLGKINENGDLLPQYCKIICVDLPKDRKGKAKNLSDADLEKHILKHPEARLKI